jgi:UTP--glucose-1-phosphate uridylyltransferase
MARVSYVRQKEPLGLGHVVLCAKDLVGHELFAVVLPDDVIDADRPCIAQMIDVFNERGGSVLATMTIEGAAISAYGVLAGSAESKIRGSTPAPVWSRSQSSRTRRRSRPSSGDTS